LDFTRARSVVNADRSNPVPGSRLNVGEKVARVARRVRGLIGDQIQ
jgi:hypothetical protein